jgi:hypothetical protein
MVVFFYALVGFMSDGHHPFSYPITHALVWKIKLVSVPGGHKFGKAIPILGTYKLHKWICFECPGPWNA